MDMHTCTCMHTHFHKYCCFSVFSRCAAAVLLHPAPSGHTRLFLLVVLVLITSFLGASWPQCFLLLCCFFSWEITSNSLLHKRKHRVQEYWDVGFIKVSDLVAVQGLTCSQGLRIKPAVQIKKKIICFLPPTPFIYLFIYFSCNHLLCVASASNSPGGL